MAPSIDPVPGPDMHSQLENALTDRLAVAEIPRLELPQTDTDSRLRQVVAYARKPLRYRLPAILAPYR